MAIIRVSTEPGCTPLIITDHAKALFYDMINDREAMEAIVDVMIETIRLHPELIRTTLK